MKKTFSRILIALALSLTGLAQADNIKTNVTITNAPFNGGAVGLAITAPGFTGPLTGNVTGNINGNMICGLCKIGDSSLNSNVSYIQVWAPSGSERMKLVGRDGVYTRDWTIAAQGCGSFQISNDAPTTYLNITAPHFCEPATGTITITGTAFILTGITGTVGQGQLITSGGVLSGTYITSYAAGSGTIDAGHSQTIGPVAVNLGALPKTNLIGRPPNSNECCFQFAQNDGGTTRWETPLNATVLGASGQCCSVYQTGDLFLSKETDAGAAPGAGFLTMKMVAGTAGSCKLIVYGGTSTTPVTLADNIGSGC